uniref:ceramidase n=1 Tax=Loa loa TaxID=7209 RepID=A0A1I7VBM2_LOALO
MQSTTMRLDRWFDYESGHAWCESAYKYQTVSIVAEFANTVGCQLIDEISILWLLMMCLAAYFPVFSFYPQQYHKYIGKVRYAITAMTVVVSTFCFVKPSLNALVLMLWSIPSIAIIHHEAAKSSVFPCTVSLAEQFGGL